MTVWPNGSRSKPNVSVGWMGYPNHFGTDLIDFDLNCAPEAGRVVYSGWNPSGAGYEVRVQADDGDIYRMLHNASLLVSFDQRVTEGQPCGVQGSTGDSSGKHCHFEVWPRGSINNRMDPEVFMAYAIPAGGDVTPFPPEDEDDEMNSHELVQDPKQGDVYYSFNRIQRYHIRTQEAFDAYVAWITGLAQGTGGKPNPLANPRLQDVATITAFGAIVADPAAVAIPDVGPIVEAARTGAKAGAAEAVADLKFPTEQQIAAATRAAIIK